jgi:decaprenyl-phosphate phosphoribosyltransferase
MRTNASRDEAGTRARPAVLAVSLVRALRPKQWLKNLLVFAAPAAAGLIAQGPVLGRTVAAFVAFCLASSALYLVNDVLDAEHDRVHPVKSRRPIAAGEISAGFALVSAAVFLVLGEAVGGWLGYRFSIVLTLYVALVLAYSLWLKRVLVADIMIVAAGFVLRAVAGGLATGVEDSGWFLLLVSLGALFVVTGKRYADLQVTPDPGARRNATPRYSGTFLLYFALALAVASVAAYVLWVFDSSTHSLGLLTPLSIAPFALAMGRYAFLVAAKKGGTPEDLFIEDRLLLVAVLAWLLLYGSGIYTRM